MTIFLCSLLLASSLTVLGAVFRVLSAEGTLYTIEAFLPENVGEDSVAVIKSRMEHFRGIESVEFVSADSALADFRRHFPGEMLDLVDDNPIPPFFRMTLVKESRNPADLEETVAAISREGYFDEVQAPVDWATRVSEWKFKMVFWPVCLSLLLLVTLSLIICNSVRLSLLSRRLLVENMKYAGGSPFFIEFPFVLEGMMQGLVGSGLAVVLLLAVVESVAQAIPLVAANVGGLGSLLCLVVLLVTLVSAYFSYRTVQDFLLAKRNERD
ncbi:ABC transporter permease [Fibrobacter sp.]|uniref:cell division protein FtsX n=1 Tax=Fibrobacter sp. TaxID=35828 RepID=UPI0025BDF47C|nr:permease-like cell division protein FtsX [Fibrobacter sp.]